MVEISLFCDILFPISVPAVSEVKRPPFFIPVRPVSITNPCSRACCDKRQTRVYLGDLAPGIDNGMPGIVTVLQSPTPNGDRECSKTALLKVSRRLLCISLEISNIWYPLRLTSSA